MSCRRGGAAKTYMARDGLFDDVDVAICWHPATFNSVNKPISLANSRIDFTFFGKSSCSYCTTFGEKCFRCN